MLIDIVVLLIICYFIVIGFRRGIWLSILHFASSIVSLYIASQHYQSIATFSCICAISENGGV